MVINSLQGLGLAVIIAGAAIAWALWSVAAALREVAKAIKK